MYVIRLESTIHKNYGAYVINYLRRLFFYYYYIFYLFQGKLCRIRTSGNFKYTFKFCNQGIKYHEDGYRKVRHPQLSSTCKNKNIIKINSNGLIFYLYY